MRDFSARALCCTKCDGWLHKSCVGMLTAEYEVLEANISSPWYCPICGSPNRSSVLYDAQDFDNPDPVGGENSVGSIYSDVSEGIPSTPDPSVYSQSPNSFNSTDTSFHSIGSRKASSSPKLKSAPNVSKQRRNLRILDINFQSVRNKGRNIDILIETTKPDIILCTET